MPFLSFFFAREVCIRKVELIQFLDKILIRSSVLGYEIGYCLITPEKQNTLVQ